MIYSKIFDYNFLCIPIHALDTEQHILKECALQDVGGTTLSWSQKEKTNLSTNWNKKSIQEDDWDSLDADLHHWIRPLRRVQVQIRCGLELVFKLLSYTAKFVCIASLTSPLVVH